MSSLQSGGYAISDLDQQRFGVRTAKAVCTQLVEWQVVRAQMDVDQVELALVRVPVQAMDVAQALLAQRALLCDVLTWFDWMLPPDSVERGVAASGTAFGFDHGWSFRRALPDEGPALETFASKVFAGYPNHYSSDERLSPARVREVYPDWLRRLHASQESAVWVLACGDDLAGVAAVTGYGKSLQDVALFGMAPDWSGQGQGTRFLRAVGHAAQQAQCERMTYSTQIRNLPARRMACRVGFLPLADYFVFHVWTDR